MQFFESYPNTNPVEVNWQKFKQVLLSAVEKNVPSRYAGTHKSRPPWLNASVRKLICKRDRLAKNAKKSRSAIDRDRYHKARNVETKAMEAQYNIHLGTIVGNVESDHHGLYRFIKSRRTDAVGITSVKSDGKMLLTDLDKAKRLSDYFDSLFTVEKPVTVSLGASSHHDMADILVTNPSVLKLLSSLDTKKISWSRQYLAAYRKERLVILRLD